MIKAGMAVSLGYTLKDKEGDVLDSATAKDPFEYLHGLKQIVPGLERQLEGLKVGERKKIEVSPQEGYGEVVPSLVQVLGRSQFPDDVQLEDGMQFEAETKSGEGVIFTITKIESDKVHVDGNHPLAGETLYFDLEVLGIREATAEEMAHGHVHGPHGHGHGHDHD